MFFKNIDLSLFLPGVLLTLIGSIALSSVAPSAYPLQFVYLIVSLLIFIFFSRLDLRILQMAAPLVYGLSIALLLITFLFGAFSRGATRWIEIGPLTFQTSEAVKPLLLVFFAWILSQGNSFKRFILAGVALIFPALLVFIQPDLGSALVIVAGFFGAILMAGLPTRILSLGAAGGIISLPLGWTFLADFQKQRIFSFLDPESHALGSGYNSIQAKIAVGSGQIAGQGLGQGTQAQLLFLPERHTDFIFASISEELGFIGAFLIIICFSIILIRLVFLLKRNLDTFSASLLGGIFMTIFVQATINIGMNVGILPITGIPLPFVSSGGSALLAMSAILGISSSLSTNMRD